MLSRSMLTHAMPMQGPSRWATRPSIRTSALPSSSRTCSPHDSPACDSIASAGRPAPLFELGTFDTDGYHYAISRDGKKFLVMRSASDAPPRTIDIAWVVVDKARVYARPSSATPTGESRARFEAVRFYEEAGAPGARFTRIGERAWVSSKDLRHPTMSPPPAVVTPSRGEHWIDVELATQTLVAYEGALPVFATRVSTGKGKQGSATATPIGVYRVWVKLLSSNMANRRRFGVSAVVLVLIVLLGGCNGLPTGPSLANISVGPLALEPTAGDPAVCCCRVTGKARNLNAVPVHATFKFSAFDGERQQPISRIVFFIGDFKVGQLCDVFDVTFCDFHK